MEETLFEILKIGGSGGIAVLFYIFIKEYFKSQKEKKNGTTEVALLNELKATNTNHLHTIDQTLNAGFDRVVKSVSDMHIDLKGELKEIKGKLSK